MGFTDHVVHFDGELVRFARSVVYSAARTRPCGPEEALYLGFCYGIAAAVEAPEWAQAAMAAEGVLEEQPQCRALIRRWIERDVPQ